MKTVLVTGGAGFIGSNYIRHLLRAEPQVHVLNLDALTYAGSPENLRDLPDPARHTFIHGDVADPLLVAGLFAAHPIDTVVHFAAETHVDRSITGPAAFIQTNIIGTFTLLEAARRAWLVDKTHPLGEVRFHHVSTDEVFGSLSPADPPFTETTPYQPRSPYAASKAGSDHLVRAYFHTYDLPVSLTNCSNNYGPYQFPEKLVPLILFNALSGKPLPIYGDGQQVRDWLYVSDHCEAIHCVVTTGKPGETYNIGGGNQPTNLELVETLCDLLDRSLPSSPQVPHRQLIRFVADRPGHDRRYAMDNTRITTELGWQPRHTLADGLSKTVDWYLSNLDWVTAVTGKSGYEDWIRHNYTARGGAH